MTSADITGFPYICQPRIDVAPILAAQVVERRRQAAFVAALRRVAGEIIDRAVEAGATIDQAADIAVMAMPCGRWDAQSVPPGSDSITPRQAVSAVLIAYGEARRGLELLRDYCDIVLDVARDRRVVAETGGVR